MKEKIVFQKIEKRKEGEEEVEVFVECLEKDATHKLITYPKSIEGFNQEIPSRRIEL